MNTRTTPRSPAAERPRPAFSLTEMLIVIGIITVLLSIILPTIFSMRKSSERKLAQADMAMIVTALNEYQKDFKSYPRPPANFRRDRVLAWALLGPFNAAADTVKKWPKDGADGPGFRTDWDPTAQSGVGAGGRVWGPYLPIDQFKIGQADLTVATRPQFPLLDRNGVTVEYYVRWQNPAAGVPLFGSSATNPMTATKVTSVYDWAAGDLAPGGQEYLRKALGDDNLDDQINVASSESLREAPPVIVMTLTGKKKYTATDGTDTVGKNKIMNQFDKCDEVANIPGAK